jgi:hypothetical protein
LIKQAEGWDSHFGAGKMELSTNCTWRSIVEKSIEALESLGLPARDDKQESSKTFPDGGQFRIEIPSTEGFEAMRAALDEADRLECPIHRFSQGSGIQMLSDAELGEICHLAQERKVEFCPFVTPRANFDTGALWSAPIGRCIQWQNRGADQLRYCLDDIFRAVDLGIRSFLLADAGLIQVVSELRKGGKLPKDSVIKASAVMAPANPATVRLLESLGANTINVATDLSVSQLSAIRQVTSVPLDIYIESPDGLGGFVRHHESPEIVRFAAPVYLKLGLRNAPDIYPAGKHISKTVIDLTVERVRRSKLVFDLVRREYPQAKISPEGSPDLGIPLS